MDEREKRGKEAEYPQLKLDNQLCFPLYAAARKVVNAYMPLLKPMGMTYTQYIVMLALWECGGKATVGDLCRRLYLDCGTITPLLKKLEESGWINKCRCQKDERVVYASMTEEGWALREQVSGIPEQMGSLIRMPQEDAEKLYRLLYQLLDEME